MTGQIPRNGWSRHFGMSDQHARNLQIDEETEDLDDQQNDPDSGSQATRKMQIVRTLKKIPHNNIKTVYQENFG